MFMEKPDEKVWFAMRATYRRELVAHKVLGENSIESFVPMRYVVRIVKGRKKRFLEPAVHNIIFVHTDKPTIQSLKAELQYLQYMMTYKDGKRVPIVVPDKQMKHFMRLTGTYDEKLTYIPYDVKLLARGVKIRVKEGPFEGLEGHLVRFDGMRNRRVVVSIDGIISASTSTASIPMEYIDILK